MTTKITPATLKSWLHDGAELALLDVREAGQFGEGHLFYAVPLPYSRLELDLPRLVPRRGARVVLLDDGDTDIAERAATRAAALGYTDLHILAGGTIAWQQAGYPLFKGVNVVSKAFGELAEHEFGTPSLSAAELHARIARGENLVVLDGRPLDEFHKMSIPGAICCPNGELSYRIGELVPNADTTIVINCAGRTRSIVGAQTLRHAGIRNPVLALRNGTMGWRLAGYDLDHGKDRRYPDKVDAAQRAALVQKAAELAAQWNLRRIDAATAGNWLQDQTHTTYLLDVRTAEEFAAGHAPGAIHAPGGQLVQATDQWLGVRQARVILADDSAIRATQTAIWLQCMGWRVAILQGGPPEWATLPQPATADTDVLPVLPSASAKDLQGAVILDLRASSAYRAGHIAGARWAIRPKLAASLEGLDATARLVLVAEHPLIARAFAGDLPANLQARTSLLAGGPAEWRSAGLDIAATPAQPSDAESIDYLFFVHDRHNGNLAAAQQYLDWETGLIPQLDELEKAGFNLPAASRASPSHGS